MIGLLSRKADELRPFDDLLADDAFWEEFALEIERQLAPRMLVIFFAGAEAAARLRRPAKKTLEEKALPAEASDFISPEALAKLGEEAIREYVSPFAKQITQTTYDGVRDAVIRSRREGTGVEGVISSIEPLFGPKRAELIAVTETTRLFGLGSQAIYRAQGYRVWEWRTAEDPWVDDECAALNGQIFPIGNSFAPAHPRCRCWPTPAFELEQAESEYLVPTFEAVAKAGPLEKKWMSDFDYVRSVQARSDQLIRDPASYNPASKVDQTAAHLLTKVAAAPRGDGYRGVRIGEMQLTEFLEKYQVGAKVELPLSSFGTKNIAETYATTLAGEGNSVILLARDSPHYKLSASESVTAGRFNVVEISRSDYTSSIGVDVKGAVYVTLEPAP